MKYYDHKQQYITYKKRRLGSFLPDGMQAWTQAKVHEGEMESTLDSG